MKLVPTLLLATFALLAACSLASAQTDADPMNEAKRQYRNGNYQAAIGELTRVTDEAPDRADAFYLIGYAHLMLREYPQSVDAFARAFELDPTLDPRSIYQPRRAEPMQ
jgi:tetratricopeptide (TPR) repeat protein